MACIQSGATAATQAGPVLFVGDLIIHFSLTYWRVACSQSVDALHSYIWFFITTFYPLNLFCKYDHSEAETFPGAFCDVTRCRQGEQHFLKLYVDSHTCPHGDRRTPWLRWVSHDILKLTKKSVLTFELPCVIWMKQSVSDLFQAGARKLQLRFFIDSRH